MYFCDICKYLDYLHTLIIVILTIIITILNKNKLYYNRNMKLFNVKNICHVRIYQNRIYAYDTNQNNFATFDKNILN